MLHLSKPRLPLTLRTDDGVFAETATGTGYYDWQVTPRTFCNRKQRKAQNVAMV
jgi:hypothetical protein